jgi:glycosyltransferase involved in cell wall biosynthesis
MRVMHVIEIRGIGGAEKLLTDFLPAQVDAGIDVICVVIYIAKHENTATWIIQALQKGGVKIRKIKLNNLYFSFFLPGRIKKIILEETPDLIHTHLRVAELVIAYLKGGGLNIGTCSTIHGFSDKFNFIKARMFIVKKLLKNFDGLCFVSNSALLYYKEHNLINSNNLTTVINNGHKPEIFEQEFKKDKIEGNASIKLILSGRLIELKGHKYAIEAMKILLNKYPYLTLDFYGAGPYENVIKQEIKHASLQQSVFLKGFTNNIKQVMNQYDIALVPSSFEAFGLVFLDAFGAKVPVVAFDLPSGNEIISHEINGLLAEPFSTQSFADNIERLILDCELRESIIKNAFNNLEAKFSLGQMVSKYSSFYDSIIKS